MATRLALVTGADGRTGSAICDRLRENGFEARIMDAVEPCDVLADLAVELIPDSAVNDGDVSVSVTAVINTFAPALPEAVVLAERSDLGELALARGTGTVPDSHRTMWNRPWTFDAMRS